MALERRDPLPPGRYSFNVWHGDRAKWDAWTRANSNTVRTISIESGDANDWVMFDVIAPTKWVGLGYPDIVTQNVKSQADQIQAPSADVLRAQAQKQVADVWQGAGQALGSATSSVLEGAGGAAAGLAGGLVKELWPILLLAGGGFLLYSTFMRKALGR